MPHHASRRPPAPRQLREVRSLRKLHHPCIVKLREVVRESDELFFVFEFLVRAQLCFPSGCSVDWLVPQRGCGHVALRVVCAAACAKVQRTLRRSRHSHWIPTYIYFCRTATCTS